MSTAQMEGLWQFLQTLSLSKSNKQWLADHLTMPTETIETPNQKYVRESLTRAFAEVRSAEKEGRNLQSLDEFILELEQEAV